MPITFVFEYTAKLGQEQALLDSFDVMKEAKGFLSIEILQSEENPQKFLCLEVWESKGCHESFVAETPKDVSEQWLNMLVELPKVEYFLHVKNV